MPHLPDAKQGGASKGEEHLATDSNMVGRTRIRMRYVRDKPLDRGEPYDVSKPLSPSVSTTSNC